MYCMSEIVGQWFIMIQTLLSVRDPKWQETHARENCASVRRCCLWGTECTMTQNVHTDLGVLMCFRAVNTADSQLQVSWALCGGLVACWQSQSLRITFPLRLSVTPPKKMERQTHQHADGKRFQFRAISSSSWLRSTYSPLHEKLHVPIKSSFFF